MTSAGVSRETANDYESLLSNLLVIEAIPAWWSNRLKRQVKSPKRFMVDSAVAMSVIEATVDGLMRDANLLGRMLETFVVAHGRREVDLVIEYGAGRVLGVEIKATSAPDPSDARHLVWLRDQLGSRFIGGVVLHTGPRAFRLSEGIVAAPIASLWVS